MKNLLTLIILICTTLIHAQDVIVRIDSVRINAKVMLINDKIIAYKLYDNQDGPTYEISRRNVARIQYANGTVEKYGKTANEEFLNKDKNVISITTTDLISAVATVNYERTFYGKFGVRLTASTGLLGLSGKRPYYHTNSYYYNRYKVFSFGVDMHYNYYTGKNISLYSGILFEYGQVRTAGYFWEFLPHNPSQPLNYYFGGITNGIKLHTGSPIELDMFCTLGWRQSLQQYGYSEIGARFGFSVGYRF